MARAVEELTLFCGGEIQVVSLTDKVSDTVHRVLLSSQPDIVVATPSRAWNNAKTSSLDLGRLVHLVLDEADLVLSYGYEEDLRAVAAAVPRTTQKILTSATITPEIDTLRGLFCTNPVVLDLYEPDSKGAELKQYVVK